MSKEKEEKKKVEVITVVYKAYLHCPKCAQDIKKPLLGIPGVQTVDVKFEKGEIKVKGAIDAKKVHTRLQKWSKKKVELISETKVKPEEVIKKETIKTITMKAYLHCNECERETRRRLLMHQGIHNVKTDMKAQTITVEGVIESDKKLIAYMRKKVHKYAEIKKDYEKKEEKKEGKEKDKEGDKKIVEFKEVKKVEVKTKEGESAYFIHYVYAPQLFSDENPNSCSIL